MTWTKQSDDFSDDCWALSDAAYRLHSEGLNWSNRKLLDCRIPKEDVARFKRPEALPELLAEGFWREEERHYVIVHHAGYQRLRADVLAQQEANTRNGRRGGRPRNKPRAETQSVSKPVSESLTQPLTDSATQSVSETQSVSDSPSESKTERDRDLYVLDVEDGSRSVGGCGGKSKRGRAKSDDADPPLFDEFWQAYPRKKNKPNGRKAFAAAVKRGAEPAEILSAAEAHAAQWRREGKEMQFIPYPASWLNGNEYENAPERPDLRLVSNGDSPWTAYAGPESPWAQEMGWR